MMVCPVMIAANHINDPTLGTKINDDVTITTPIAPPHQAHQGNELGGETNRGGKLPVQMDNKNRIAVTLANEINAACSG